MTILINIALFVFLLFSQSAAAGHLQVFGFVPNLILIFILSITLFRREYEIYLFAFAAGIIMDILSGGPFGINTSIMMLIAFVGNIFKDKGVSFSIFFSLVFVASSSFVYYLVHGLYIGWISKGFEPATLYFYLGQILITVAVAFILFPFLDRLFLWEDRYEERKR